MHKNLTVRSINCHRLPLVVIEFVKPNLAAIFSGLGAVVKFVKSVNGEAIDKFTAIKKDRGSRW